PSALSAFSSFPRRPPAEAFNLLISLHASSSSHDPLAAVRALSDMIRSGALPNSRTYTVLIDHLLRSRHLDAASQIFYLLPSMRARRTSKQYDVLAAALAEAGRFDDLRALIREFRCDGILPGRPMLAAVKAMREAGFVEGTDEFVKELSPDSRIRYTVTLGEEEEQNEEEEDDEALRAFRKAESAWEFFCWVAYSGRFAHDRYTVAEDDRHPARSAMPSSSTDSSPR
ncbi:Pentatricopeptide repeat-containing protein, partial [Ananas comosus]